MREEADMRQEGGEPRQIVVYKPSEAVRIEVKTDGETVWLTQEQMCLLFGRDQSVIARHIKNVFKENELEKDSVYAKSAYTASDGKVMPFGKRILGEYSSVAKDGDGEIIALIAALTAV